MHTTVLTEQMDGVLEFDNAEPQKFALRLCAPATEDNPVTLIRPFTGTISLEAHPTLLPCDGLIELRPSGPIYEFRFTHPEFGPVAANGRKLYRLHNLLESLTQCPLTLYRAETQQPIGAGHMAYTQPLWHFPLESLSVMSRTQVVAMKGAFSNQPFAGTQYAQPSRQGFYESWFVRANHPTEPQALWIRYTRFMPRSGVAQEPGSDEGELWAIWFNGASAPQTAYQRFAGASCRFDTDQMNVDIGGSRLDTEGLKGQIRPEGGNHFQWVLRATGEGVPLLLLPENRYPRAFPKAKSLVLDTDVTFSGTLTVGGQVHAVDQWRGSFNHNWGARHTDEYAWGQVAGFDDHPDVFLECATARLHFGPLKTPTFSPIVLKVAHETLRFNQLMTSLRNTGTYQSESQGGKSVYHWTLEAKNHRAQIRIRFTGDQDQFATLDYRNPAGGLMRCLNSKIAQCEVILKDRALGDHIFRSQQAAAFEILSKK